MKRRSPLAVLVLALALGATSCGASTPPSAPDTTTSTTLAPTTSVAPATSVARPTTTQPTTTAPPATTQPTATLPPPPELSLQPVDDDPRLPAAEPYEAIPWGEIGPGWILATLQANHTDPGSIVPYGLYLIGPDDVHYAVGTAGGYGWSFRLQAWSPDGLRFLAVMWSEADEAENLWLGDLETHGMTLLRQGDQHAWTSGGFVGDGHLVVITGSENRSTIELLSLESGQTNLLIDEARPASSGGTDMIYYGASWVAVGSHLVTVDSTTIQLRDLDGAVVATLDLPAPACTAVRTWDAATALVMCADTTGTTDPEFEAWGYDASRGLWLVPLDGSAATKLAGPGRFGDALAIGDTVVFENLGCCECGGTVEFLGSESWWDPPQYEPCSPELVMVRNGKFLVADLFVGEDRSVRALFELELDGTMGSLITDATGPYGGLMTVVPFPEP